MARVAAIAILCLGVTILPLTLACRYTGTSYGERGSRANVDGGPGADSAGVACPVGERCDPATPFGLAFAGALPAPHPIVPVAAGGRETVRVYLAGGSMPSLRSMGWAGPFAARATDVAVLRVRQVAEPDVDVGGVGAGAAFLRVVSPSSGLLYDRISLDVRDVATTRVTSYEAYYASPHDDIVGVVTSALSHPMDRETLIVQLADADESSLWDDSLRVEGRTLGVFSDASWPWVELGVAGQTVVLDAHDAGHPIDLVVTRDAATETRHLDAVAPAAPMWLVVGGRDVETHRPIPTFADGDVLLMSDATGVAVLCAVAMTSRGPIAGAPITLSGLTPSGSPLSQLEVGHACVAVLGSGDATLTATLGTMQRTVRVRTVPDGSVTLAQPLLAAHSTPGITWGERASR